MRIRAARRLKVNPDTGRRYTQEEAARAVGMTRENWNRLERDRYKPERHAVAISEFLGIPLAVLDGATNLDGEAAA